MKPPNEFKMIPEANVTYLPMRDWLELGQALADKRVSGPKYFRAYDTDSIWIGGKLSVKAGGKIYGGGRYRLMPEWVEAAGNVAA